MPRRKSTTTGNEPKKRSRNGCHGCKSRKVKCDEGKPKCSSCLKLGEECDYSIKLQWGGRSKKEQNAFSAMANTSPGFSTIGFTPSDLSATNNVAPATSEQSFERDIDRNYEINATTANPRPEPSAEFHGHDLSSSFSRGQNSAYALPDPYRALASPSDQNYRLPSISNPPSPYDFTWSNQDRNKRVRLDTTEDPSRDLPPLFARPDLPVSRGALVSQYDHPSPGSIAYLSNTSAPSPLTAGTPVRRLSVNSLLSGPPGDYTSPGSSSDLNRGYRRIDVDGLAIYGYDYGMPDLDIPKNDDLAAINPQTPATAMQSPNSIFDLVWSPSQLSDPALEKPAFEKGGYYARPVPIRIPTELEPLPPQLKDSPMNLVYFHHFLNHTARILVPHDCPDNPMKTTLPRIAMRDPNLLNLLLAYSASHRARLLGHPEPVNRLAIWLRNIFPDLRRSLSSHEPVSNATLTTAIMLASREAINPDSLDVPIPWQTHLEIARQIIISRGGLKDKANEGDPYVNFLARWFAYLDVIGSLSGHRNHMPLDDEYMSFDHGNGSDAYGFTIDCFFGFTSCCISLLAQVARLARKCDRERMDENGNIDPNWRPSSDMKEQAELLKAELSHSRHHEQRGCRHSRAEDAKSNEKTQVELQEMVSVNETFHLAGLIHLDRRVLGKPSTDAEIQDAVKLVLLALQSVRKGGTAESCLLFPMFTAGCDAQDVEDRDMFLQRIKLIEGLGMMHVRKARQIMEKAWDTGKPWETLVTDEFLG